MIGLSLLPTPHPSPFQRKLVRASSDCYGAFTLDMGRSLGFASARRHSKRPLQTRSRYGSAAERLNLASPTQLVGSLCKRHAVTVPEDGSHRLWARGFRLYFTPLHGVLPTFPSRYWFAIGLRQYSALRDGPRGFGQDSTCPALLRCQSWERPVARTGVSPSAPAFSKRLPVPVAPFAVWSYNPGRPASRPV